MTLPSLTSFRCFACGQDHPNGLRLRFTETPLGVRSEFSIGPDHVGLGEVVHGGIVATVFDEAMAWTLYRHKYAPHLTATMEQRFRRPIMSGTPLVVEATITDDRGSRVKVSAELTTPGDPDDPLASASGLYVRAPDSVLDDLSDEQRADLARVFATFRDLDGRTEGHG